MADGGFPDQHTTSTYTTTTQESARPAVSCTLDTGYARSLPGILKIVEIILGLLYWTVVVSYYYNFSGRGWVVFVGVTAWVFTLILFILFLFSLAQRVTIINWPLTELINNASWCLLHFIAAIIISVAAGRHAPYIEHGKLVWGSLCGWTLFVLYLLSTFFNGREFQAMGGIGSFRQPTTTTTTTTTTVISTTGTTSAGAGEKSQDPPPYPGGPFT